MTEATTTETMTAPQEPPAEASHMDALHGRARVILPPRSPEPAEARALAELAATEPQQEAPPTYAAMLHLFPR